jgi:hypothetical protein
MVRLLQVAVLVRSQLEKAFNPTMVRLLHEDLSNLFEFNPFQSHNGAIAAPTTTSQGRKFLAFNPTMVRLLPRQNFGV